MSSTTNLRRYLGVQYGNQLIAILSAFIVIILASPNVFAKGGGSHRSGQTHSSDTHVQGHMRKNGTYVQPHVRTSPNRTQQDNYTSKPNVNPYTGKDGTKVPTR